MTQAANEHTRLLDGESQINRNNYHEHREEETVLEFDQDDQSNPKQWMLFRKYAQVLLVFIIGLICPMASSMIAPANDDIAETFKESSQMIILGQTGFVCMLGIGPLFLAPMSETFGRRTIFLINLTMFTLVHIPIGLAPNVATFVAFRTMSGLFGSVGVANGGGVISDMFASTERATVFGFYLLGPLLGPSLGPFLGGVILVYLHWRWIFWVMFIISVAVTVTAYFLLLETNELTLLQQRKKLLEQKYPGKKYTVKGDSDQSMVAQIARNSTRASKILFTQPIVLVMSIYQALVFASMYSIYTAYDGIWSNPPYSFSTLEVALSYLGPAVGFTLTATIVVPFTDRAYRYLEQLNNLQGKPEYRLPLANIGALFLPISLFWFGWTVEKGVKWPISLAATLLFGGSQVSIFNAVQNYYIEAFSSMAASALAAGAFFRSMVGGIVPLFAPQMFQILGYGWGMSVFGVMSVILMPAPLLFYYYGPVLRERFAVNT